MKTIALFFGGLSNEATVSIMSAKNVAKAFDRRRYQLILVFWNKKDQNFYLVKDINKLSCTPKNRLNIEDFYKKFDIALLMTHGRYGEDGVLQAIFESRKIKYCGCRVLGSAVCMDKILFKSLMKAEHIRQVEYGFLDFKAHTSTEIQAEKARIKKTFSFPVYVKPANSGSSVGITRVDKPAGLDKAIKEALRHDSRILIEKGLINPTEIEVAVMGNDKLIVSRPGQLRLAKDFYDFDDKYKRGEAQVVIPAKISAPIIKEIKNLAPKIYRAAGCQGFARVDFFVSKGKIYINEINTLPGFTDISMFPMLMMDQGMTYTELINRIVGLAY
jgi:D-alanine-D-alanine ligase